MTRDEREKPAILIVDDDAGNIRILANVLRGDYDLYYATDGADALTLAAERLPDLVLLDAEMPGFDGFQVCAELRGNPVTGDIPVIFVTAHSDIDNETRALETGAVDFISKPISPPIVRARVRNHLTLKQQADMLRRQAATDGLTGIANRRMFDQTLDREWRRGSRTALPLALLMVDVDCFKRYNDLYGHQDGDACLRVVAQVLAGSCRRPGDLAARYGGEEFVVLLPDTSVDAAAAIAGRLCADVAALAIPHSASDVADFVTVSVGAAAVIPSPNRPPSALVALSDQALYLAKQNGRHRAESLLTEI